MSYIDLGEKKINFKIIQLDINNIIWKLKFEVWSLVLLNLRNYVRATTYVKHHYYETRNRHTSNDFLTPPITIIPTQ